MRKFSIYTFIVSVLIILAYSCESYDDFIPSQFDKILSIKDYGDKKINLYNIGEDGKYTLTIMKGGNQPNKTAQAEIKVMSEAELEIFSQMEGRSYKLIPSSMYQLESNSVFFDSKEHYQRKTISFKTNELSELKNGDPTSNYVLPIKLLSSTDSVNAEKSLLFLKPEIVTPVVNYEVDYASVNVSGSETSYELRLIMPFESPWDFNFTVGIDNASLPAGYLPIESDLYSIANEGKINFVKGSKVSEPLKITIQNGDLFGSNYVIPIKIQNSSLAEFQIPEKSFMLYGIFNHVPLSNEMLVTNAQEWHEGPIENLIDANPTSYFHSAYTYYVPDPHFIQINLKNAVTQFRFNYVNRNNGNGKPQDVQILVSNDNNEWMELTRINNLPAGPATSYSSELFTTKQPFKYFRYVVLRTNDGPAPTFFSLAEISLYGK